MKQIDLGPENYRESGRQRVIRSILHKPVFLTISAVLGAWVASAIGVAMQYDGFARAPQWAMFWLYPSLLLAPAFWIFAALVDGDRVVTAEPPKGAKPPARRAAQRD